MCVYRVGAGARARPRAYLSFRLSSVPFFPPSLSLSLSTFFSRLFVTPGVRLLLAPSSDLSFVSRWTCYLPARLGVRVLDGSRSRARIIRGRAMRGGRARTEPSDGAPRSFMNGPRTLSHIWKRRVDCQPIPALRSPINARLSAYRVCTVARVCRRTHAPLPPPRHQHVVTASHCSQASPSPPRRPSRAPTFP